MAMALWVLMHINEIVVCDPPTIMLPCISELRTFVQYYHKFCASEYDRIIAISIIDS